MALVAVALCATGCGKTGTVKGKVTFDGKALPAGRVTFKGPDGKAETAEFADGEYTIKAPIGDCKIAVETDYLALQNPQRPGMGGDPMGGGGPGGPNIDPAKKKEIDEEMKKHQKEGQGDYDPKKDPSKLYVAIPDEYKDPEKSKQKFTVAKGSQTHDIELTKPEGWKPPKIGPGGSPK
jgi:hypothetical protein